MVFGCCLEPSPAYMPVSAKELKVDDENFLKESLLSKNDTTSTDFPGSRRRRTIEEATTKQLVRTGGNAWMEYYNNADLVHVTIPQGTHSGQLLEIQHATDGRTAYFCVPTFASTGSTYLMQFPPKENNNTSISFKNDSQQQTDVVLPSSPVSSPRLKTDSQLVLVCVPPGVGPGTKMQVTITSTNERMTVTVPPGGVSQFYVTKPLKREDRTEEETKKQQPLHNWQDHPSSCNPIPLIARPRVF